MNCVVVDAFSEGRTAVLAEYLRSNGHAVVIHADQLDAPGAWVGLVQNQDTVFLHVGEDQRNAIPFFRSLPPLSVFCYSGSEAPVDIVEGCGSPGARVLCPENVGRSSDAGYRLTAVVSRWLGCIEGRVGSERFVEAWHTLRNLDIEKEESLEALEKQLTYILSESHWTPAQVADVQLRDLLKTLRDQRISWGI